MLHLKATANKYLGKMMFTFCFIWVAISIMPHIENDQSVDTAWRLSTMFNLSFSIAHAQDSPKPLKESLKKVSRRLYKLRSEKLYYPAIHEAADKYQVDPALIKAIIKAESGYNPEALSHRGAIGLMQLMPSTAKSLGVEDCFNPKHNINGGVKYFSQLLDRFNGNVRLALAAYNAGSRYVKKYRGIPPFKATRIYVKKVIEYYQNYKKQLTTAQHFSV
jgi:soluble lytic murein transglycosylase-like protein